MSPEEAGISTPPNSLTRKSSELSDTSESQTDPKNWYSGVRGMLVQQAALQPKKALAPWVNTWGLRGFIDMTLPISFLERTTHD